MRKTTATLLLSAVFCLSGFASVKAAPQNVVHVGRSGDSEAASQTPAVTQVEVTRLGTQNLQQQRSSTLNVPNIARLLTIPAQRTVALTSAPVQATQTLLHHAAVPTVVRTVPTQTVLTHAVPHTVVRTAPAQTTHLLHHTPAPAATAILPGRTTLVHNAIPAVATQILQRQPQPATLVKEAARAQYKFGYSVADSTTGDSKTREEERDGDVVRGSYSVADADGRIRTVTYTADAVNGFQAEVLYDGARGPPALGSDAPTTAEVISARTPTVIQAANSQISLDAIPIIRTVSGGTAAHQGTAAQVVPAFQTVRTVPAATTAFLPQVRTVPGATTVVSHDAVHRLHAAPAPAATTVVRTAAPSLPSHIVAAAPAQTTLLRTNGLVHHSRTDPHSVVTPGRFLQLGNAFHPGTFQVVGLGAAPTTVSQPTIIQA